MCMPSGGGGGSDAAAQQQQQEHAREARIKAGNASINKTFAPFNDDFYAGRSKAYTDWAQPQLEDQYADQRKSLTYGLARNGLLSSTVANDKTADLKKQYDTDRIQLADQGLAEATKARQAVNSTKMDLQNQLTATGDPSAAASNALAAAKVQQSASAYTPLGNMFGNVASGLNDAASAATDYRGIIGPPYGYSRAWASCLRRAIQGRHGRWARRVDVACHATPATLPVLKA
jgi:hypothetical protein